MKDPTGKRVQGRTRWRRFLVLFGPAMTLVTVMVFMVANGLLAVSFEVSGVPFKLTADQLSGTGFTQIGALNHIDACPPDQVYYTGFTTTLVAPASTGDTLVYAAAGAQNIDSNTTITITDGTHTLTGTVTTPFGLGQDTYSYLGNNPRKMGVTPLAGSGPMTLAAGSTVNVPDEGSCVAKSGTGNSYQFTAATLLTTAKISNLHQTVCIPVAFLPSLIPGLGADKYMLVSLSGGSPVATDPQPTADNLIVDATALRASSASFTDINIGQGFTTDPSHAAGLLPPDAVQPTGPFGGIGSTFSQQAPTVTIDGLAQEGTDTTAGTFTLPNLNLSAQFASACP